MRCGAVPCVALRNPYDVALQSPRQYLLLTLYGHIKTAEQLTIIQQYGDWYTGRGWVDWYQM